MKRTEPRAYPAQDSVFISIYFFVLLPPVITRLFTTALRRFSGKIVAEERF